MVIVSYQSSCIGLMYPAARMFKETMLGSVMVSPVWGVVRRHPKKRPFVQWASSRCEFLIWGKCTQILPTTRSWTSFHSTSAPDSCTMVTIILLCRPCSWQKKKSCSSDGRGRLRPSKWCTIWLLMIFYGDLTCFLLLLYVFLLPA